MWSLIRGIFKSIFPSPSNHPPVQAHREPDPEQAFKNYDQEFYDDHVLQPDTLRSSEDIVLLDQKAIQQKFLEIIKYYNDVVMTNTMVFSETEVLNYQKQLFKLENERKNFMKSDPSTIVEVD